MVEASRGDGPRRNTTFTGGLPMAAFYESAGSNTLGFYGVPLPGVEMRSGNAEQPAPGLLRQLRPGLRGQPGGLIN
jgi:hypothetical protein